MSASKKVVLAYSGGLDTSVCLAWLKERGFDVVTFCAELGQGGDLVQAKANALKIGAIKAYSKDLQREFAQDFVRPALQAGAIYEQKYLLATALSRPLIAKHLAAIARKEGAAYVAHGCTGKGNDQVRFEVALAALLPKVQVLAPVREWELASREEEIVYAKERGIPVPVTKKNPYSLDENLWGVSIECGALEDPWNAPPEDAYQWTTSPLKAPRKPTVVTIDFVKGVPVKLNGRKMPLVQLIARLNALGSKYGIGRADLLEDRLVGLKSREIYEAPGATILHAAHQDLEALNLHREVLDFKELVARQYARLVYDGLWYSPLRSALDGFVKETQAIITGSVKIRLTPGQAVAVSRKSPKSLYQKKLATYSDQDEFDQSASKGFIQIWGLPYRT